MEELFNKPILEQMYEFRKKEFEQNVYDKNEEIRSIQNKKCEIGKAFTEFLKEVITDEKNYNKLLKMFNDYEQESDNELELWGKAYFKLGMIDRVKIRNEFFAEKIELNDKDTFINYESDELAEWIEVQKSKYIFGTEEYKKLVKQYKEISEKYPKVMEVFEDFKPIVLDKDEMKALIQLREIDVTMGFMEKNLSFKLGMKEVMSF